MHGQIQSDFWSLCGFPYASISGAAVEKVGENSPNSRSELKKKDYSVAQYVTDMQERTNVCFWKTAHLTFPKPDILPEASSKC